MALGIKTTTAKQIGDTLFSDGVFAVYSDSNLSQKEFDAYTGQDLGIIKAITTKYIKVDFDDPYEGIVSRYFPSQSPSHPMANPDFDYQGVVVAPDGTQTQKTGGFFAFLSTVLGFGTEVLKNKNSVNPKDTIPNKGSKGGSGDGTENPDPNASGAGSGTNVWLFVGAGVLLIILLIVVLWKPKPKMALAPQTTDAPQVVKLS